MRSVPFSFCNRRKVSCRSLLAGLILAVVTLGLLHAQSPSSARTASAQRQQANLAFFQREAELSKKLGANYMLVTAHLPAARWEMNPNDPYPMWFVRNAALLIIFPPRILQPYVNLNYSHKLQGILKERCAILHKYGLQGVWNADEPAVLPEAFFTAYPQLRGPRVDQTNRSRNAYFAPTVDAPEVLRMYRQAMRQLLNTCPEVEQFNWRTTDAGSGFGWTPSLYPGMNGNTNYENVPLSDRVSGFLINAQKAAKEAGHAIEINLTAVAPRPWMIATFSPDVLQNTVRKLPPGLAVEGREGPDGRPFAGVTTEGIPGSFYPLVGIVVPPIEVNGPAPPRNPPRLMIDFGDRTTINFNYRLLKFTRNLPMSTLAERVKALHAFAASEVGAAQADNLLQAWSDLNDVKQYLDVLNFGSMLRMGDVLERWIIRPLVPFPQDLTAAETKDYRSYIFQAKGASQADDLVDIQGMREYQGWGASLLFQRAITLAIPKVQQALHLVHGIQMAAKTPAARSHWELTGKRLQALIYLLQSAENVVLYQAQLDRVKKMGIRPNPNPVLGYQSSWARTDLMGIARNEIDTMVDLELLLQSTKEPVLDLAPTQQDETIMRLGPNIVADIKHKIDVMNAHWRDYDRLFTEPNP